MKNKLDQQKRQSKKLIGKYDEEIRKKSLETFENSNTMSKSTGHVQQETNTLPNLSNMSNSQQEDIRKPSHIPVIVNGATNMKWEPDGWKTVHSKRGKLQPKNNLILVGDESIRGMGQYLQGNGLTSEVVVRGGHSHAEANRDLLSDLQRLKANDVLVTSYGIRDMDSRNIHSTKNSMLRLINAAERQQNKMGMLRIPPQSDNRRNEMAKDLNRFLECQCKNSQTVFFIDPKLSYDDTSKEGKFLSISGKNKTAEVLRHFVKPSLEYAVDASHTHQDPESHRV